MTQRERILSMVVMAMLPFFVVFAAFYFINGSLRSKNQKIRNLNSQIEAQQLKQLEFAKANDRRFAYIDASLGADLTSSESLYWDWLNSLAEAVNFAQHDIDTPSHTDIPNSQDVVFTRLSYRLTATGTLPQLVEFMFRFHDARVLHRVSQIIVDPHVQNPNEPDKETRSGLMEITLDIDAAVLAEADDGKPIPDGRSGRLADDLETYQSKIVRRNAFALANRPPSFSGLETIREIENGIEAGETISFPIPATDEDKADILEFELVKSSVEGATFEKRTRTARRAQFKAPNDLEPGDYEFTIAVYDSGLPSKRTEQTFVLPINEQEIDNSPPFAHANSSKIVLISRDVRQQNQVTIYIPTRTSKPYERLIVGQSFELDGKNWTLMEIEGRLVKFDVDGKLLVFKKGSDLASPIRDSETESSTTSTGPGIK